MFKKGLSLISNGAAIDMKMSFSASIETIGWFTAAIAAIFVAAELWMLSNVGDFTQTTIPACNHISSVVKVHNRFLCEQSALTQLNYTVKGGMRNSLNI